MRRGMFILVFAILFGFSANALESIQINAEPYAKKASRIGHLAFFKTYQQSFKSAGNITQLDLEEGQLFSKGDILAKVDTDDLSSELNQLIAEKAFVNKEIVRLKKLKKVNAVSESELDQMKSRSSQLRAQIIRTREFLDAAMIIAPFDGVVINRYVDAGEFVNPGQAVLALAPLENNYVVEVAVQDFMLDTLSVGQQIMLNNRQTGATLLGEIKTLAQMPEQATGLFVVKIAVTEAENARVGNLYDVVLTQSMQMVFPVPIAYAQLDFNQTALVMANNKPTRFKLVDHDNEFVYLDSNGESQLELSVIE
jgi:membrane fusion protein, multidrug efflux system